MNTSYEREIDLIDLFRNLLKRRKLILLGTVIIALLAGLYKFISLRPLMKNTAEYEAQYQEDMVEFEQEHAQLEESIALLSESISSRQEYNTKSPLMAIDPLNKWNGSFVLYIDPEPSNTASLTGSRLASAYYAYLTGGELYNELSEKSSVADEARFLSELIDTSLDTASSSITVSCIGRSEADVKELMGLIQSGISSKQLYFTEALDKHELSFTNEAVYVTADQDLKNLQSSNSEDISTSKDSLSKLKDELSALESSKPARSFGSSYVVKQTAKILIIGAVAGFILTAGILFLLYVFKNAMRTDADWEQLGIPVLAKIRSDKEMKTDCLLAASNLCAVLKAGEPNSGAFTGDIESSSAEEIINAMNEAHTETQFSYAGSILDDPEAANRLAPVERLILLGQKDSSKRDNVQKELTLLKAWGKEVIGAVILE